MTGSPLHDPRITAVGLLIETHDGLQRRLAKQLTEVGLPRAEFDALLRLARSDHERLRLHDLATQLDLSNSGASRLVDRLVGRGLVVRATCDTDRRGAYAVITDEGRSLIGGAIPAHLELIEEYYTGVLEPDELDALSGLLRKVRDVVHPGAEAGTHELEAAPA
ncbi:MAG: MarR family transcriptional regulator [Acidimicrobiia bacterium]|nr:MarR family transcriptional regulator [Acidimicrobiia bacterium]